MGKSLLSCVLFDSRCIERCTFDRHTIKFQTFYFQLIFMPLRNIKGTVKVYTGSVYCVGLHRHAKSVASCARIIRIGYNTLRYTAHKQHTDVIV